MINPAESEITNRVCYGLSEAAWRDYDSHLRNLVLAHRGRTICEIGGGANPALPIEFVVKHDLDYVIMDISAVELAKAPRGYRTRVQDVTAPIGGEQGTYDLVFSRMLAEHVRDGRTFHSNMHALLKPGGIAFHFFPTLYAPPYVLNWLLPERMTYGLLNLFQTGRERSGRLGKFPAYYQWCRGPSPAQFARFESVGFKVVNYTGFFGHPGYYQKFSQLLRVHRKMVNWLLRHPKPWLTSFSYVILEKR